MNINVFMKCINFNEIKHRKKLRNSNCSEFFFFNLIIVERLFYF